jgi:hypothetical protein
LILFVLFVLVAAAAIAYFVWDLRRKTAAREAASSQRFAELLRAQARASSRPETSPAAAPATGSPASAQAPVVPAAHPPAQRFLGQAETLLYYLLKTGIPDHEVFANVPLAAVVGAPGAGAAREQQLRRLAPYQLGFVVCNKSMRVVAAVEVEPAVTVETGGAQNFKAECLEQAGIRLVRVNPAALPRRDQIRAIVCGPVERPKS